MVDREFFAIPKKRKQIAQTNEQNIHNEIQHIQNVSQIIQNLQYVLPKYAKYRPSPVYLKSLNSITEIDDSFHDI